METAEKPARHDHLLLVQFEFGSGVPKQMLLRYPPSVGEHFYDANRALHKVDRVIYCPHNPQTFDVLVQGSEVRYQG